MELIDHSSLQWSEVQCSGNYGMQQHQQLYNRQQQQQHVLQQTFGAGHSSKFPRNMQLPIQLPAMESACMHGAWESCEQSYAMYGGHALDGLHSLQPHGHPLHPTSIARRNERERNRVKTINSTFSKLRAHLPCSSSSKSKKLSKVQILRAAIQYINQLANILEAQDSSSPLPGTSPRRPQNAEVSSTSRDEDERRSLRDETSSERDDDDDHELQEDDDLSRLDWLQ
jgi:achaete-scute complex protein